MKFKRLEINNIASIKHAVIEFDKDPIKSSQLFLINGPTGSGKSIIFDSICLALFRTAPRLENLGNRSIEDWTDGEGSLKLSSPMAFVRRGESEAWVELVFEGNNGHIYKARWETELFVKGEKKGCFKGEKQYVIDLTDNAEFRGAKELKDLVKSNDVVGLDFDRFTRTTMLAQGAFTRFLSADEKEKSEILRKIVGLDYFSLIGKKVSEIYTEKKRELDAQRAGLNSITFMDEETLTQTKHELSQTELALQIGRKEYDRLKRFVDYKEKMARLDSEVERHRLAWAQALEQVTSDGYFELVTLETYLDRVAPLGEIAEKLAVARKTKESLDKEVLELARKRKAVSTGLTALAKRISTEQEQISAIEQELKSYDEYSEVLDKLPVLKENIKQHDLLGKKLSKLDEEILALTKESGAIDLPIKDLDATIESVENELKKSIEDEQQFKKMFDESEFNRLTSTGNELASQLKNLNQAIEISRKIDEILLKIKTHEKEKNDYDDALIKLQKDIDDATIKSADAQKQLSEFKDRYDRARRSVSDIATELRHGLKAGDNCPVCGSQIQSDLLDDAFQEALKPLDEQLEVFVNAEKVATTKLNELNVSYKTTNTLQNNVLKSLKSATTELESVKDKLKKNTAIGDLAIDVADLTARLTDKITVVENLIAENNKALKKWGEIQSEVVKASDVVARVTAKLTDLKQKRADKISQKEKLQVKLDSKTKEQEVLKTDLNTLGQQISDCIPANYKDLPYEKFVKELDEIAKKRELLNANQVKLSDSVKQAKALHDDIEKSVKELKLTDIDDEVTAVSETDLRDVVARLIADVAVNYSRKEDNACEISELIARESDFYSSNNDMSREYCQHLLAIPENNIKSIKEESALVRKSASECFKLYSSAIQMVKSQRDVELETSVDITVEEGTQQVANLATDIDNLSIALGALQQKITTDDENKKRFATQREAIEKLESDVALWLEVNNEFGGQHGERFSRVASAYALNNLIERANFYLSKFSPRYILSPNAGSLEISIYDNLSGYTRAFNTMSGGESFVISLSLALALSAIQDARMVPDTIFIDEGFGTLSGDYLDRVMTTLEQLQLIEGRRVALISHVDILRERIPVKITVTPLGNSSKVEVISE